jgi:hypothetical protein
MPSWRNVRTRSDELPLAGGGSVEPTLQAASQVHLPEDLDDDGVVFSSHFIVPQGYLRNVRNVTFVHPEKYFSLRDAATRNELGRAIGRLNPALEEKTFICVGPGRWGAENFDLGVYMGYADICKAGALVALSGQAVGPAPEPSLGTHFFQDLIEAEIVPVAVDLDRESTIQPLFLLPVTQRREGSGRLERRIG